MFALGTYIISATDSRVTSDLHARLREGALRYVDSRDAVEGFVEYEIAETLVLESPVPLHGDHSAEEIMQMIDAEQGM